MEEMTSPRRLKRINYGFLIVSLILVLIATGMMLFLTVSAYEEATKVSVRDLLTWLAWAAAAAMALTLLMLTWIASHWIRFESIRRSAGRSEKGDYPSAWSEAGKRIEAPDAHTLEDPHHETDDESEDYWKE